MCVALVNYKIDSIPVGPIKSVCRRYNRKDISLPQIAHTVYCFIRRSTIKKRRKMDKTDFLMVCTATQQASESIT